MSDIVDINTPWRPLALARCACYVELTKPGIAGLVLVATGLSFALGLADTAGLQGPTALLNSLVPAFHTLFGTALVAGAANAMNQLLEVPFDRQMIRTQDRPLPSARLTEREVLTFSAAATLLGLVWLLVFVNGMCAALVATSWAVYVFAYTPLKRLTSMSVFVGAIPGALPPLIGWAGATGHLSREAWILFAVMFFWQLPHFASIAWLYREDYARAGYPVLPTIDRSGLRTSLHVVTHSVGLLFASLLPALYGQTGLIYATGAMVLGLAFLGCGIYFIVRQEQGRARLLLLSSLVYLPSLLMIMVVDRIVEMVR